MSMERQAFQCALRKGDGRRHRIGITACALIGLLSLELVFSPVPIALADEPATNTPIEAAFPEAVPSSRGDSKTKLGSEDVGATGAFGYSLPIEVPPGRNGMAPSLALSYSSDAAQDVSAFGAGWSIPVSAIRRSTKFGTPAIAKPGDRYVYADDAKARFERDGVELAQVRDDGGAVEYRDRIDQSLTKTTRYKGSLDYWVIQSRDGSKHYYGDVPGDQGRRAVVEDDLGVREWLLLRSEDPFGNVIDYGYEKGGPRSDLTKPQLQPLLAKVQHGRNLVTGLGHHAQVDFAYRLADPASKSWLRLDHARGHVYLDRILDRVEVSLLSPERRLIRTYQIDIRPSPSTGRFLLYSFQEKADDLLGPKKSFEYTRNDGQYNSLCNDSACSSKLAFAPSSLLSSLLKRFVFREFWELSPFTKGLLVPWKHLFNGFQSVATDLDAQYRWPGSFLTQFNLFEQYFSPPGIPAAFRFLDADGDGDTDVLYMPTFAGGVGYGQPWASSIQNHANGTQVFSDYELSDPLAMRTGATDLVDVDRDGVVDRIGISPSFGGLPGSGAGNSLIQDPICEFWWGHGGGVIDPNPQLLGPVGDVSSGGLTHGSLVTRCNEGRSGTVDADTLVAGWKAALQASGGPDVVIEKGRLLDPRQDRTYQWSTLGISRKPRIELEYQETNSSGRSIFGKLPIKGVRNIQSVYMPIVDLDASGVPEVVSIKSSSTQAGTLYEAGVFPIAQYKLAKEDGTRFASTLDEIFTTPKQMPITALGGSRMTEQYQCPNAPVRIPTRSMIASASMLRGFVSGGIGGIGGVGGIGLPSGKVVTEVGINTSILNRTIRIQRLIPYVDWVSQLIDANADGLPDLVMAKGATCVSGQSGIFATNHQPGFDVFLNRGDRFETSADPGKAYAGGPFEIVRNWNAIGGNNLRKEYLRDVDLFPFSTLGFTDLDGDGATDAILSAAVIQRNGADMNSAGSLGVLDAFLKRSSINTNPACDQYLAEPVVDGTSFAVRCVWRGSGAGWIPAKRLAQQLPRGYRNSAVLINFEGTGGITGSFVDSPQVDRVRYADFNNDGLTDIIAIRSSTPDPRFGNLRYPEQDPTRIHVNEGKRPDLLRVVENGLGARTTVTHAPASRASLERVPNVPWVVTSIVRDPLVGGDGVKNTSNYEYEGGRYDFAEREFLGFRKVIEKQPVTDASANNLGTLVVEREFYQAEQSLKGIPNPLKGALKSKVVRGEGVRQAVETTRSEASYEVVSVDDGARARVRALSTTTKTCKEADCASKNVVVTEESSEFDEFDNPQLLKVTASRTGFGDGFDGTISVERHRRYRNDTSAWILGLATSYLRVSDGEVLASEVYDYDRGRLKKKETGRLGADDSCISSDNAGNYIEEFKYFSDGNLEEWKDNNNGAPSRKTYTYDPETRIYVASSSSHYTKNGRAASLTSRYSYDRRFGTVQASTDPNGNTASVTRDALGRLTQEVNADGQTVREHRYDWSARPIVERTFAYPGSGQPTIETVAYKDGWNRPRQSITKTATGVNVDSWVRYDSMGGAAEAVLPFAAAREEFLLRGRVNAPMVLTEADVLGREIATRLPDGRAVSTSYQVAFTESVDAEGIPRRTYDDALGRVAAVGEYLRSSDEPTSASPVEHRTVYTRDGDGNPVKVVDPDGNVRLFAYDQGGRLVRTTSPRKTEGWVAGGDYLFCYDRAGNRTRSATPEGRVAHESHDALGRITARQHDAPYDGDDVAFEYDDPSVPNGLGRPVTTMTATGTLEVEAYDRHGNAVHTSVTTSIAADAGSWGDGTFHSTAQHDALGRPIKAVLPSDPQLMAGSVELTYKYNERGLPKELLVGNETFLKITEFAASGKPRAASYRNGVSETWQYAPLNDRLQASTTTLSNGKKGLGYLLEYDPNDNPVKVTRSQDPSLGPAMVKGYAFDTLNRVEHATTSIGDQQYTWDYRYSPAGNIQAKDGLSYAYDRDDPQAVTARKDTEGNAVETYTYDRDGQMSEGHYWDRDDAYSWDGDGRLAQATRTFRNGLKREVTFRYGPDGGRLLKKVRATPIKSSSERAMPPLEQADIFIGALELRGTDGYSLDEVAAYYNVSLGTVNAQLALRRDQSQGWRLARDPAADRFYHKDYLGSTAMVTASNGTLSTSDGDAGRLEYGPYGEQLWTDDGATRINTRYTGKEWDEETGLTYYGARYAHAGLGRWVSRDPLALVEPEVPPQAANLFAFADNNPITKVDPDGRASVLAAVGIGVTVDQLLTGAIILTEAVSLTTTAATLYKARDALREGVKETIASPPTCCRMFAGEKGFSFRNSTQQERSAPQQPSEPQGQQSGSSGNTQPPDQEKKNARDAANQAAGGVQANKAAGDAWSQAVGGELKATHDVAVPEITVRTQSGVKTRLDWVTKDSAGSIGCVECKASATAPLTPNQALAHPEIGQTGAVVVGKGKPGIPGGTVIPPTPVQVRRP